MSKQGRRTFIKGTAAATAALAFPYIRTSHAAGSLSVGFWDHWVPGANDTLTKICQDWGEGEGRPQDRLHHHAGQQAAAHRHRRGAGEGRPRHPRLLAWDRSTSEAARADGRRDRQLEKQYGKVVAASEYLSKSKGHWIAVPARHRHAGEAAVRAPRPVQDRHAGIDFQEDVPAGQKPSKEADNWDLDDACSRRRPALQKAGHPIGLGLGQTTDSIDWVGALFHSYGATSSSAKGNTLVKSNAAVKAGARVHAAAGEVPAADVFAWTTLEQQVTHLRPGAR
jgi:hypothetical protein